jgi:ATP-dependent helicase/DNAse subunit B
MDQELFKNELTKQCEQNEMKKDDIKLYQEILSVLAWMEQIPKKNTWTEWISWLANWIRPLKQIDRWQAQGRNPLLLESLAEELHAWQGIKKLLEGGQSIQRGAFSGQKLTLSQFIILLEQAASQLKICKRKAQKGGVQFLAPNLVQGHSFRVVILLGCVEGKYPRPYQEDWLVPNQERRKLREEGVYLIDSEELRQRQLYSFFMSINAATDKLIFSYPYANQDGKKQLPSPYLEECFMVFHENSIQVTKLELTSYWGPFSIADCYTSAKGRKFATYQLGQKQKMSDDINVAIQILEHLRLEDIDRWKWLLDRIQVEQSRYLHQQTPFTGKISDKKLQKQIQEWLKEYVWHVSDVNQLLRCPFQFMAGQLWQTTQRKKKRKGLGSWKKEQIIRDVLYRVLGSPMLSEEEGENLVHQLFMKQIKDGDQESSTYYFEMDQKKIWQQVQKYMKYEMNLRSEEAYDFHPRYINLTFGKANPMDGQEDPHSMAQPISIQLGSGSILKLRGKVDRIDMDEQGDYIVYIYQSSNLPSQKELYDGQDVQLPLILWALQQGLGLEPEKVIGIAYYTKGKSNEKNWRNRGFWKKEHKEKAKLTSRALLEPNEWGQKLEMVKHLIDEKVQQIEQGGCDVKPTWSCPPHCPHQTICRIRAYQQHKVGDHD